jgi:hypothetical protein
MSNENNNIASKMQHPELDIVDRLLTKHPLLLAEDMDLAEAAQEIRDLRKEVKDLTKRHAHMSNIALGSRADVHQTRRDLDKANKERDAARRDFCNASYDDPHLVARERGWDCFKNEKQNTYICDHCGDPVDSDNVFFFHTLPQDIASANKGESATTCRKCCEMIDANANNQDFRTTDMG